MTTPSLASRLGVPSDGAPGAQGIPERMEARRSAPSSADASSGPPEALERAAALVAPTLARAVERLCPEILPIVDHHLGAGGKRLRAALAVLSAEAVGAPATVGVLGAVAVELVHNFSLVHDDVIDGDTERRHRRTVWAQFGLGAAIVAGDALAALATELLLEEPTEARARAARLLARATAAMIAGQAQDMAFEGRLEVSVADCREMEAGKTGALLACAASLGAVLAGATDDVVAALSDYGHHLGLSFQAVDDALGIWGEPAVTGKPVGNDLLQHKKTLPVALAMEDLPATVRRRLAVVLAGELTEDEVASVSAFLLHRGAREGTLELARKDLDAALAALGRVPLAEHSVAELEAIARFVTERDH